MVSEPARAGRHPVFWRPARMAGGWQGPGGGRTAAGWAADTALFGFAVVTGGFALGYGWHSQGKPLDVLDLGFGVLACLGLWIRRSSPGVVLAAIGAAAFSPAAAGAGLVAICTAAAHARGRTLIALVLLVVASSVIFPVVNPADGELVPVRQSFPAIMFAAIAFGWGLYLRTRRELIASLRERARQLEAGRQRSAELARQAERRRIAREMHDVLAHRLSLLSVHAGALEFRPHAPAAEVAQAAAVIRTSAAAALGELRQVVTVLRDDTDESIGSPQPDLARLPDLIEESRAAGMTIRAHLDLQYAMSLAPSLGGTIYRVVQEGLTNARKHAPGAPVAVTVSGHSSLLAEIISGRPAGGSQDSPSSEAGAGLIGLAERLALAGGTLEHGTNTAGEFILRAAIPLPS
jgi:signal transduction histidine kinase